MIIIACMKLRYFIIRTWDFSLVEPGSALFVSEPSGIDNVGHRDAADIIEYLLDGLDADDFLHRRRRN